MNTGSKPEFKDHFSGHAPDYARYRPSYPGALYDWLASEASELDSAWDVATGNGQAARELAKRFRQVIATDGSEQQLAHAVVAENIEYRVELAETNSLKDHSVDLITAAQAYHWFDHKQFLLQATRVVKPRAVLAIWTYALAEINPQLDRQVRKFYSGPLESFWPPERRLVEEGYASLEFPWKELQPPDLQLELRWSLQDFLSYLRTWSAVRRYGSAKGIDPVSEWEKQFKSAWGDHEIQTVTWPMRMRAFRLP